MRAVRALSYDADGHDDGSNVDGAGEVSAPANVLAYRSTAGPAAGTRLG
jgi:hypothetical protein